MERSLSEIVNLSSEIHSGRYGPRSKRGTVLYSELLATEFKKNVDNKELQILLDLSGSMSGSLHLVQASIQAFLMSLKENRISHDDISLTIIGYNSDAWVIYAPGNDVGIDDAVNSISAGGKTDMGKAIELGFSINDKSKCTWMLILSDGVSNAGKCQTLESFKKLKERTPANTSIVTVGYGSNFDIEVLRELGRGFVYAENIETIPTIFGSLAHEVTTSLGFNASMHLSYFDPSRDNSNLKDLKFVIGENDIGSIYSEKNFITGLLIEDPELIESLKDSEILIVFEWLDIPSMSKIKRSVGIKWCDGEPSDTYREAYYNSCKGRRMDMLRTSENVSADCNRIRSELREWTEDCAVPHQQELLKLITGFEKAMKFGRETTSLKYLSAAKSFDTRRQETYTKSKCMTTGQKEMVKSVNDHYSTIKPVESSSHSRPKYSRTGM